MSPTVWIDGIGRARGIPAEYMLQKKVAAGFASLIPLVQINKNVNLINLVHYNVQRRLISPETL